MRHLYFSLSRPAFTCSCLPASPAALSAHLPALRSLLGCLLLFPAAWSLPTPHAGVAGTYARRLPAVGAGATGGDPGSLALTGQFQGAFGDFLEGICSQLRLYHPPSLTLNF